jgi:hypothetical protein
MTLLTASRVPPTAAIRQLSNPDRWWRDTVDLIIFGLERILERSRHGSGSSAS